MYTLLLNKINALEAEVKSLKENMIFRNKESVIPKQEKRKEPYKASKLKRGRPLKERKEEPYRIVKVDDIVNMKKAIPYDKNIAEQIKTAKDMYDLRILAAQHNFDEDACFGVGIGLVKAKNKMLKMLVNRNAEEGEEDV